MKLKRKTLTECKQFIALQVVFFRERTLIFFRTCMTQCLKKERKLFKKGNLTRECEWWEVTFSRLMRMKWWRMKRPEVAWFDANASNSLKHDMKKDTLLTDRKSQFISLDTSSSSSEMSNYFLNIFQVMDCLEKASWWSNSLPCDTCLLTPSLFESFSTRIMNKRYLTAGCLQISPQTTLKAQMVCKWKISTSSTAWSPSLTFLRRSSKSNEFENYFSSVIVRLLIRSRKKRRCWVCLLPNLEKDKDWN